LSVCVIGSLNVDYVARVATLPLAGETVMASGLSRHVGGKGANQAVAAARAGAVTRLIGAVGRDEGGDWLCAYLAEAGVEVSGVVSLLGRPTGQAFITVSDAGENAIVVVAGANASAGVADPAALLSEARVLLAQLEIGLESLRAVLATPAPGCVKVLNAAPAAPAAIPLFAHCDLLIINETELAAYAGVTEPPADLAAIERAAKRLPIGPGAGLIVTLGAAGVLAITPDGTTHLPAYLATVLDTVGAGDCFCGVLAAGLDAGLPLIAAAGRAAAAAALVVSRKGAAEAMPTLDEIEAAGG
jgi:ribokinase